MGFGSVGGTWGYPLCRRNMGFGSILCVGGTWGLVASFV